MQMSSNKLKTVPIRWEMRRRRTARKRAQLRYHRTGRR